MSPAWTHPALTLSDGVQAGSVGKIESFEFAYALDWAMNLDRLSVHAYGVHHGVEELKSLASS